MGTATIMAQTVVPEDTSHIGRWWGIFQRLAPCTVETLARAFDATEQEVMLWLRRLEASRHAVRLPPAMDQPRAVRWVWNDPTPQTAPALRGLFDGID